MKACRMCEDEADVCIGFATSKDMPRRISDHYCERCIMAYYSTIDAMLKVGKGFDVTCSLTIESKERAEE